MPQQINLCTPILLTQKRYFSAQTLLQALAIFVVMGGALCAYWVWSLNAASEGFKKTLAAQAHELESLQKAIAQGKAGAAPVVDANLTKDSQSRRSELTQREKLLQELQRGWVKPGLGHAAQLQLLAQTIPAPVWVTAVKADDTQFEVSGFTLETAALSDWVARLAASPLLEGQKLATVKVENATAIPPKAVVGSAVAAPPGAASAPSGAASAPPAAPRAMWAFHLVSTIPQSINAVGVKP